MRTTWNGSISFGLVSIPVGLAPATKPAARASDISFRMLHRECLTPIKQKRFCPVHERDLGPDEIVKGWEVSKGQFVVVEEEEIEALTSQDDSRSIEISRFVDAARGRPDLLRPDLLPRARPGARGAAAVRAAAERDARDGDGGDGPVRPAGPREALPDQAEGRGARARDALRLGGRVLAGRDRGGGRGDDAEGAGARARAAGDREPRRRLRSVRAPERLPARPQGVAGGQARRRGDLGGAGAGRGDARDRPDGGAPPLGRGGAAGQGAGRRRRPRPRRPPRGLARPPPAELAAQDRNPPSGFRSRETPEGPLARPKSTG